MRYGETAVASRLLIGGVPVLGAFLMDRSGLEIYRDVWVAVDAGAAKPSSEAAGQKQEQQNQQNQP
jgi:predicted anti-sigma-YlaC factor YlaD